jgi:transposase
MYTDPKQWQDIRDRFLNQGVSKRQIMRETGMHWKTVTRILNNPFPVHYQPRSRPTKRSRFPAGQDQAWRDLLDMIANAKTGQARAVISALKTINPWESSQTRIRSLQHRLREKGFTFASDLGGDPRGITAFQWMVRITQGAESRRSIAQTLGDIEGLPTLIEKAKNGTLRDRNRALTVLACSKGVPFSAIATFINKSRDQVIRYWKKYEQGGVKALFRGYPPKKRRAEEEDLKELFFSILHAPPSEYNINRTSWRIDDLKECLRRKGNPASKDVIRELIRDSGFRWKSAKVVLTSNDPDYRAKLENITFILSSLGPNDRFCSIDEYGPFAVSMKGGVRLAGPDETPYVQQFQRSKGCIIMTASLELSQNQITHFYSEKKNTMEMIRMLAALLDKYRGCETLYMSWDAASWHVSNALYREIDKVNSDDYRALNGTPTVKVAPLPSRAQFLNVIESVFSGMARAIIHNSDYQSVAEAKAAIDRYFAERNEHFQQHPKRAGRKIWGKERVISEFSQGNNCKDPKYS